MVGSFVNVHFFFVVHRGDASDLYVPMTDDDTALFTEQHKFEYQVLEQAIHQSLEGMVIIPEYSKTKDTQAMYAKLKARYAHSQAAALAQGALKLEFSDLHLDTTWKKGCIPFLVAFKNRIMNLENQGTDDGSCTAYLAV
jgi:hypothetical protein